MEALLKCGGEADRTAVQRVSGETCLKRSIVVLAEHARDDGAAALLEDEQSRREAGG